jgi:exopolyphosphatase/guanosine-5'-triphosphate,3'-diphosphate pyrophosphatase
MEQVISGVYTLQGFRAVADLGSNTFHLMVGRFEGEKREILLHRREAVGIGKDGMAKKRILPDAIERALGVLQSFAAELRQLGMEAADADVYATSAFRNAENAQEVLREIERCSGFRPRIISGQEEAGLIFQGVLGSGVLKDEEDALVVDIGGGSVEFILCRGKKTVWQESLEIGGLRLMERFHYADPLPSYELSAMELHLKEVLKPVKEKISGLTGLNLVGCSGSFDTMIDIRNALNSGQWIPAENSAMHELSRPDFLGLFHRILPLSLEERLSIPGMIPLRAGMMVVALCLVKVLLEETASPGIRVSTWSLKEGALLHHFPHTTDAVDQGR